jgi:catechol 2,3-dioxygenase-like lactoylglutathione lyase family enzyme
VHNRPQECRVNYQHGLELVHPTSETYSIGALLKDKGQHVFTVVWDVESIDDARAHLQKNGFEIQYEGDFSAKPDLEIHKQIVVRPERTHGLLVIFQERRLRPGAKTVTVTKPGLQVLGLQRAELLVRDPDAAEATYKQLFNGLDFESDVETPNRPLDCRIDWDMGLELVHPTSEADKIGQLLKTKGEHVFTVVWDVNDMDAAKAHLAAHGFEVQWEHDFGPHGPLAVHKQLVIRPERTHGLLVIFQERRMKADA